MVHRYIKTIVSFIKNSNDIIELNLITPQYNELSFGYSKEYSYYSNSILNAKVIQISNGSNGEQNFGEFDNWQTLCTNTATFINNINNDRYDKIINIYNDVPFTDLANKLNFSNKNINIWIPHSTVKIHSYDAYTSENSMKYYARLGLEINSISFINTHINCYVACISEYMKEHLITEYGLHKQKIKMLINGEILDDCTLTQPVSNKDIDNLLKSLNENKILILSYGRAEKYKGLETSMYIGSKLNLPTIIIAQSYYKTQPILDEYKKIASECNSKLIIDPPFNLASIILNEYKGTLIVLLPSKRESMGLIINEIRKLNKNNILVVANDIDGFREQIKNGIDGVIVNFDNIESACDEIRKNLDENKIKLINKKAQKTLVKKYNFIRNFNKFKKGIL